MSDPQPVGADLARMMLHRAQADARNKSTGPKKPKRVRRTAPGSGREPQKFGGILDVLAAEHNWKQPTAGGSIIARWPQLLPQYAPLCTPDRYDADTRTLHLRAVSPTAAAKLRWEVRGITEALNRAVGGGTVTAVKVTQYGAQPRRDAAQDAPETPAPRPAAERAPRTRADASQGFHRALAALQDAHDTPAPDNDAQALRDRYFADTRGILREAEPAAPPTPLHRPSATADDARARALAFKRAEQTGRPVPGVRRLGETA